MLANELVNQKEADLREWLVWENGDFHLTPSKPLCYQENRETLARLYKECTSRVQSTGIEYPQASQIVRSLWREECDSKGHKSLPGIIGQDGFLSLYALGLPCSADLFSRIWKRLDEPLSAQYRYLEPLEIAWNESSAPFYDVDATPQGLLSKLSTSYRLKKDQVLLEQIASDLREVSHFKDGEKRKWVTLAILSHGAAYRELEGHAILIPSFTEIDKLILYRCTQHLIAEGLKTVSLVSDDPSAIPIYLCQGTEFWPSQPSMLGSILANFGEHGSATEAYAHSWRRIHKHIRDLPAPPLVAGHSMGGSLAMQIALYSRQLIECAYAFNPPVPNARDYNFYHQLSKESKDKVHVIANLDDFAFWRIGSKIIGNVTIYLGKTRWKYYAIGLWDCVFLFPAFFKFIRNVHHAFPAHQRVAVLYESWVSFRLSQEEIEKENEERTTRFDYLHFLPKLYDPLKVLLSHIRKVIKWGLEEEYLRNEIEIVALHERDLLDTLNEENRKEVEKELQVLKRQKETLINRLHSKYY